MYGEIGSKVDCETESLDYLGNHDAEKITGQQHRRLVTKLGARTVCFFIWRPKSVAPNSCRARDTESDYSLTPINLVHSSPSIHLPS